MKSALRPLSLRPFTIAMRRLSVVLPLFAFGCTAESTRVATTAPAEAVADSEQPLVGGRLAQSGEYGSTVEVAQNCTGSKVGPRHFLVAAHCVHDTSANVVQYGYLPGAKVRITNSKVAAYDSYKELTVEETHIFPAWLSACVAPCPLPILTPTHPADVAVIVVREETPAIPAAEVDPAPVHDDDKVVVTGFGCENGLYKPFGPETREEKVDATRAVSKEALSQPGSFVAAGDVDGIAAAYVVTPGHASADFEASLCFGDSGGPLYRGDTASLLVVGINAYYTFPEPFDGVSQTNWHTRLDASAPGKVTTWLEAQGVAIHHAGIAPEPKPEPETRPKRALLTSVLQAEDYAKTGAGVGYSDSEPANRGGAYRKDGVDIEATTDDGGGFDVGWTAPSEWLAYDVTADAAGAYDVSVRVAATANGKALHVEIDGRNVSSTVSVPNTGGWQAFRTVTVQNIAISAGNHSVRVVFDTDGVNLNWLTFKAVAPTSTPPVTVPTRPESTTTSTTTKSPDPAPASPCAGLCEHPVAFTSASYSGANLGTGASCYETRAAVSGLACGNVVAPRAFGINGVAEACGGASITMPKPRNGGYCVVVGAGDAPWAWFSTW